MNIKTVLLSGAALGAVFAAAPASAACVASGADIACTGGTETNSVVPTAGGTVTVTNSAVITGAGDAILGDGVEDVDVTVSSGSIVRGATRGIDGASDWTVTNSGTIEGLGSDAIRGEARMTVTNGVGATIWADDDAIQFDGGVVDNAGDIIALDKGITTDGTVEVYVRDGARILSGNEAIEAGDNSVVRVEGSGYVEAVEDAIQLGRFADVVVDAGAQVVSTDIGDGMDLDSGSVVNRGLVSAVIEDGIDFDADGGEGATIRNEGVIQGFTGVNVERGLAGDPANTSAQVIANLGLISGTSGIAIDLGEGDDGLILEGAAARMEGDSFFREGDDRLVLMDDLAAPFADGTLFDGGAGTADTVAFDGAWTLADLTEFTTTARGLTTLTVLTGTADFTIALAGWEIVEVGGAAYAFDEIFPADVPLPAGALLLPMGLLALAGLRRKRG
ncbi:hypothetical protein ACQ5SO_00150 [Rhodovulum sp. DZ06]|uniref:hypothetical protein n=1 Tax=Rhodovulum sp. DZ06 TaxID=3425126 RepID=UPI003D33CA06